MGLWKNALVYLGFAEDDLGEEISGWSEASDRRIFEEHAPPETTSVRSLASVHKLPPRAPDRDDVRVIRARSYEDARTAADILRSGENVIVNVDGVEPHVARRVIAFSCGLVYALDAGLQKVGRGMYMLTPPEVEVRGASYRNREYLGF